MPETTVQSELLRLQCLQTLGITVYHPRFLLPGAKPSVQGPWPDADAPVEENASRTAAQHPATLPTAICHVPLDFMVPPPLCLSGFSKPVPRPQRKTRHGIDAGRDAEED